MPHRDPAVRKAYNQARYKAKSTRKPRLIGHKKTKAEKAEYDRAYQLKNYDRLERQRKAWRAKNQEKMLLWKKNHHLLKTYGITVERYDDMLAQQGHCCAICKSPKPKGKTFGLHVDHDHVTGEVRGLLCFSCNSGLGNLKDDPELLRKAISYLEK